MVMDECYSKGNNTAACNRVSQAAFRRPLSPRTIQATVLERDGHIIYCI
jgi:hypothetical protein